MPSATGDFQRTLRLIDEPARCSRCEGSDLEVVGVVGFDRINRVRSITLLCALCLAEAMEALTGFGFVAQLRQWSGMQQLGKAVRGDAPESKRAKRRHAERASTKRRMKEQLDG